jgi:hypothetical protein
MRSLLFRYKITARSPTHAQAAKFAEMFIFLLSAETPESKNQHALRATIWSFNRSGCNKIRNFYSNTCKTFKDYPPVAVAILCFPASQRKT